MRRERRYTVDTNLYIDAMRAPDVNTGLRAFHDAYAPFEHLSAVVVQELRAGVRGRAATKLESAIIAPFERRSRVFTPSYAAWKESGRVLAELVGGAEWESVTRSFVNDVLLALSCRESGVVLVTRNLRDCSRINAVRPFDYIAPWPIPAM